MPAIASNPAQRQATAIFIKTVKGRDEIQRRSLGLSNGQRQVLILVDGIRQLGAINHMLQQAEFHQTIGYLYDQDLITPCRSAEASAPGLTPALTPGLTPALTPPLTPASTVQPVLTGDPEQIRALKHLLSATAIAHLGLLSSDICRRIEHASGAAALYSVLGQWHMALRQSKNGGAYAGLHLRQIEAGFYGAALPAWPQQ